MSGQIECSALTARGNSRTWRKNCTAKGPRAERGSCPSAIQSQSGWRPKARRASIIARSSSTKPPGIDSPLLRRVGTCPRPAGAASVGNRTRLGGARHAADLVGVRLDRGEARFELVRGDQSPNRANDRGEREALRGAGVATMPEGGDQLLRGKHRLVPQPASHPAV